MLQHAFGVQVHGLHEGAHVLRVHVRVEAVAQVGDVAPRAEALQHLLHNVGNALLVTKRRQRGQRRQCIHIKKFFRTSAITRFILGTV